MTPGPQSGAARKGANLAFGEMLDSVPGAWFFTRRDGSFAYVSVGACEALGYTRQELLGARVFDIDPTMTDERWNKLWEGTVPNESKTFRTVHRRRDGSEYPIEIRSLKIELDGERADARGAAGHRVSPGALAREHSRPGLPHAALATPDAGVREPELPVAARLSPVGARG